MAFGQSMDKSIKESEKFISLDDGPVDLVLVGDEISESNLKWDASSYSYIRDDAEGQARFAIWAFVPDISLFKVLSGSKKLFNAIRSKGCKDNTIYSVRRKGTGKQTEYVLEEKTELTSQQKAQVELQVDGLPPLKNICNWPE
jgi:hypothetical protein